MRRPQKFAVSVALMILVTMIHINHAYSQDFEPRSDEYMNACAACHGENAKGGALLGGTIDTPDLTKLANNNDGEFPLLKVFRIIDGRTQTDTHGSRMMPIWGDRFKLVMDSKYGEYGSEPLVRSRILELVYYLQSIQEE